MKQLYKWIKWLVGGLGGILLLYLALVYLLIGVLLAFPQQVINLAGKFSGTEISYSELQTSFKPSGIGVSFQNLSAKSSSLELDADLLNFDLEILFLALPFVTLGESLEADRLRLHRVVQAKAQAKAQADSAKKHSQEGSANLEVVSQVLSKVWRQIDLEDLVVTTSQYPEYKVVVNQIDASRITNWNLLADFELRNGSDEVLASYSMSGRFQLGALARIKQGSLSIEQKSSASLKELYRLLPEDLTNFEKLPDGNAKFLLEARLINNKLDRVTANLDLDRLRWKVYKRLPRSLGVTLSWSNRQRHNKTLLAITNLKVNHKEVEGFHPIQLERYNTELGFYTEGITLDPLLGILNYTLDDKISNLKNLKISTFSGVLDTKNLLVKKSLLELDNFVWGDATAQVKIPSLVLQIEDSGLTLTAQEEIEFFTSTTQQQNYSIKLEPWKLARQKDESWLVETANFSINSIPFSLAGRGVADGWVDLELTGAVNSLEEVKQSFLPYGLMDEELVDWLQTALVQGKDIQAKAQMRGRIQDFPFIEAEGFFKAQAKVADVILDYDPDWPLIEKFDALVEFEPYEIKVSTKKAEIFNAQAKDVFVKVTNLAGDDINLFIQGKATTEAQNGLNFLLNSPLAKDLDLESFLANYVTASGVYSVVLDEVQIPLEGEDELLVKGGVELSGEMNLFDKLDASQLNGKLNFSHQGVITSQPITFQAFNSAQSLSITTDLSSETIHLVNQGSVELQDEYGISGLADLDVRVNIPLEDATKPLEVVVAASNPQLSSSWPSPLDTSFINNPFSVNLEFFEDKTSLALVIDKLAYAKVGWQETPDEIRVTDAAVFLGAERPQKVDGALLVKGAIKEVDLDAWDLALPELKKYFLLGSSSQKLTLAPWVKSSLAIDKIVFQGQDYPELKAAWHNLDDRLQLSVSSDYLGAELLPHNSSSQYNLKVSHLYLQEASESYQEYLKEEVEHCSETRSLFVLPRINFYGENLVYGKYLVNQTSFQLEDSLEAMTLKNIDIRVGQKKTQGLGWYQWDKAYGQSELTLNLSSKDVAAFTDFLKVKQGFSGRSANLTTHLKWPRGPQCFSLNKVSGPLKLRFDDGVIEQIEPGLARLVGLISIDSIVRRLKLDVKDITSKGLEYDRINFKSMLGQGKLVISDMNMKSPGVRLEMKGKLDLDTYQLDMKAKVTPAMGGALTTIATVAGIANPLAGLLTYLFAKTTPFINEDLITYDYKVTGDLENPVMKSSGASVLFK